MWQGGLLDCVAIDSSENNGTFKIITKKMNVCVYICVCVYIYIYICMCIFIISNASCY